MKAKGLHIRISERRLNKIRLYAAKKEKQSPKFLKTTLTDYRLQRLTTTRTPIRGVPPSCPTIHPHRIQGWGIPWNELNVDARAVK
jgi:hypothetical protein